MPRPGSITCRSHQSKCRQLLIEDLLPHPHSDASTFRSPLAHIDWKATALLLLRKDDMRDADMHVGSDRRTQRAQLRKRGSDCCCVRYYNILAAVRTRPANAELLHFVDQCSALHAKFSSSTLWAAHYPT